MQAISESTKTLFTTALLRAAVLKMAISTSPWLAAATIAIASTLFTVVAQAQDSHGHGLNQSQSQNQNQNQGQARGAHIHGEAAITLASIDNIIEIQLTSPAANLLGFEHTAVTAQELEKLSSVRATLQAPSQLFSFSGTSCEPEAISIDLSGLDQGDQPDSKHDAHDESASHENHDEEHHDHHHEREQEQEQQSTTSHSEVFAKYQFKCKAPVAGVNFTLFDAFTGIEEISVAWLTGLAQGASKMTPEKRRLKLN